MALFQNTYEKGSDYVFWFLTWETKQQADKIWEVVQLN